MKGQIQIVQGTMLLWIDRALLRKESTKLQSEVRYKMNIYVELEMTKNPHILKADKYQKTQKKMTIKKFNYLNILFKIPPFIVSV